MVRVLSALVLIVLFLVASIEAAVWDEPWHKDVVLGADSFGLYDVVNAGIFTTTFARVRTLAGMATDETVTVDGFYGSTTPATMMTRPGQNYDDEWTLRFRGGRKYYLLLKRAAAPDAPGFLRPPSPDQPAATGPTWRIATPTAGFAEVRPDGTIVATYRHTLHQAVIDATTFELTQTCIFDSLHPGRPCAPEVRAFIDTQLNAVPASLLGTPSADETTNFFKQHAALETAYLTSYSTDRARLKTFLQSPFFHTQISAVRALARLNAPERNTMLAEFVADDTRNPLARVCAVEMLRELKAVDVKDKLTAYLPGAPTAQVTMGASVSDSRIGTRFPSSVKSALERLLAEWK